MKQLLNFTFAAALSLGFCHQCFARDTDLSDAKDLSLIGNWNGDSICQVPGSACRDEKVAYHLAKGRDSGHLRISADKIVDGKPINMGGSEYAYNPTDGTLVNDTAGRVWKLTVRGKTIEGTLTMPDKTVYRRLTLTRAE